MSFARKVFATLGLAGLGVAATSAVAVQNQLDGFTIVNQFPLTTILDVQAPIELAGAPCTVLSGPEFGIGMPVGSTVLMPGHNMLAVPNLPGPEVYTAIGPFEARPADVNGHDNGIN